MSTDVAVATWPGKPTAEELADAVERQVEEIEAELSPYVEKRLHGVRIRHVAASLFVLAFQNALLADVGADGGVRLVAGLALVLALVVILLQWQRIARLSIELWFEAADRNSAVESAEHLAIVVEERDKLVDMLKAKLGVLLRAKNGQKGRRSA